MGLDQYLTAEKCYSGYEFQGEEKRQQYKDIIRAANGEDVEDEDAPIATVGITLGTWRKANAIHSWFVNTIQNGHDDCGRYFVSREDLKVLLNECQHVINFPEEASKRLPTQAGFFFGSTATDLSYLGTLCETVDIIEKALKADDSWEFYYSSSW